MLQLLMQQLAPSHSPLCRAHAAQHRPTLLAARAAINHLLFMHTSTSSHNKFKRARYAAAAAATADPGSNGEAHQQAASTTTTTATTATPARPKVIIITGPTAVGKTKLGLELAKRLGGEIISADSVQVYRGLDVGSDKVGRHLSTAVCCWQLLQLQLLLPAAAAGCFTRGPCYRRTLVRASIVAVVHALLPPPCGVLAHCSSFLSAAVCVSACGGILPHPHPHPTQPIHTHTHGLHVLCCG